MKWFFGLLLSELGEKGEHLFYDKLHSIKDDTVLQDTLILNSINFFTNVQNKMNQEIDVLIFCWTKKLIICIEIKRILNTKAFNQLEKYHKLIEERMSDQLGPGWTYHPVVCVEKDALFFNNQHYITHETDLKFWLSSLLQRYSTVPTGIPFISPVNRLQDLLRIIVFAVHASKTAPITTTNWVEYITEAIDTVCTADNIIFYSQRQLPIIKADRSEFNKLILYSAYGCGKTFLIQEKAKQLAGTKEYTGRIMYIVEREHNAMETLLEWRLKDELGKAYGINIYPFRTLGPYREKEMKEEQELLISTIREKNIKALLIDECNISEGSWKEIIRDLKQQMDVIWIASNGKGHIAILSGNEDLTMYEDFTKFKLDTNLRNPKSIVQGALMRDDGGNSGYKEGLVLPPANFPNGVVPAHVGSLGDAIKEMRKVTNDGVLVIAQVALELDFSLTSMKWKMYKRGNVGNRSFKKGESPYQYLVDGNILFIDEHAVINGFEWPNIISVEGSRGGRMSKHPCNWFMRCTANLVIVN
uniref:Uncharacterized protein n=1 Tax=Clytia hemisphaerica TaxID=252671 RepID=A0A7M5WX47_9CNID